MVTDFRKAVRATRAAIGSQGVIDARRLVLSLAAGSVAVIVGANAASASSQTWTDTLLAANATGAWTDTTNWSASTPAGVADGTFTNTDIATFSGTGVPVTDPAVTTTPTQTITVDANRNVGGITFDNNSDLSYTIAGPNALHLTGGGITQAGPTYVNTSNLVNAAIQINYLITAPIVIEGNSYTFRGNGQIGGKNAGLQPRGGITFHSTGAQTLTLDGAGNDGNQAQNQVLSGLVDGPGGALSVVKNDSGTWELNSSTGAAVPFASYSGDTVINAGFIRLRGVLSGTTLTASGVSPNSMIVVNGTGVARFGNAGLVARGVTLNDTTTGSALMVSTTASVIPSLQNNTGPALVLNFTAATPAVVPTNCNINFTGTTPEQGGIKLTNGPTINGFAIGQTSTTYNLGSVSRLIDIGLGRVPVDANDLPVNPYDLRIVAHIEGTAGFVKTGPGRLRVDSTTNGITGTIEVRAGQLLLNNANAFTAAVKPDLFISGGSMNIGGGQTQTFSTVGLTKGSITASNGTSTLTANNYVLNVTGAADTASIDALMTDGPGGLTGVNKSGPGAASLGGANTYTGLTNINGGSLTVDGDANDVIIGGPNAATPGGADIQFGKLIFDYTNSTSPQGDIVPSLKAGRAIDYASFPAGQKMLKSSTATGSRGLGWLDDTANFKFTVAAALYGDTNLDGKVNFTDLLSLAQNYGTTTGAIWAVGDTNYDGNVNFNDLLSLAQNYGQTISGSFSGDWALAQSLAVPEPATIGAMGLGALLLKRRRVRA